MTRLLFLIANSIIVVIASITVVQVVQALPNNNKGPSIHSNSFNSRSGGRSNSNSNDTNNDDDVASNRGGIRSSSSVALRDSFPCESDEHEQQQQHQHQEQQEVSTSNNHSSYQKVDNDDAATTSPGRRRPASASSSSADYLTNNSFMAQNDIQVPKSPTATTATKSNDSLPTTPTSSSSSPSSSPSAAAAVVAVNAPRGGTIIDSSQPSTSSNVVDDDDLDRMVENLIAGIDDHDDHDDHDIDDECSEEGEEEEESEAEGDDASSSDMEEGIEDDEEEEKEEVESEEEEMSNVEETDLEAIPKQQQQQRVNYPNHPIQSNSQPLNHQHRPPGPPMPHSVSSSTSSSSNRRQQVTIPPGTPTNAYYRFLVRRGPPGHILASFSLLSIQWIHAYLPVLYRTFSTLLLKLRIYDSRVLRERDYRHQLKKRYGSPPEKRGFASKLFGSTSSGGREGSGANSESTRKAQAAAMQARKLQQQKMDDVDATSKLKQLYKAVKVDNGSGSAGSMSEVKYRYLSEAFRKKHHLGREYRIVKPRTFMGELIVEDGKEEEEVVGMDDAVYFSDGEDFTEDDVSKGEIGMGESSAMIGKGDLSTKQTKVGSSSTSKRERHRRRPERKKMNDWVVKAFASSVVKSVSSNGGIGGVSGTTSRSISGSSSSNGNGDKRSSKNSLWATVDRGAILNAAWESRAAEQMATKTLRKGRRRGGGAVVNGSMSRSGSSSSSSSGEVMDAEAELDKVTAAGGSSYGASKMFQSVMTRVGSNGRIFGAYPNDALPIQLCAHEEGVVQLARRYGYGDWRRRVVEDNDDVRYRGEADADSEDGDDDDGINSWGGGDLMLGGVDESEDDGGVDVGSEEEEEEEGFTFSSARKSIKRTPKHGSGKRRRRRKNSLLK